VRKKSIYNNKISFSPPVSNYNGEKVRFKCTLFAIRSVTCTFFEQQLIKINSH